MTNRCAFILVAVVAAALFGCGSVGELPGDGGADLGADLVAPPSDIHPSENPSDGGADEVPPPLDAGAELPPCRGPAQMPLPSCGSWCYRCLGQDFATLAAPGELCAPSCIGSGACAVSTVCVSDCRDCP